MLLHHLGRRVVTTTRRSRYQQRRRLQRRPFWITARTIRSWGSAAAVVQFRHPGANRHSVAMPNCLAIDFPVSFTVCPSDRISPTPTRTDFTTTRAQRRSYRPALACRVVRRANVTAGANAKPASFWIVAITAPPNPTRSTVNILPFIIQLVIHYLLKIVFIFTTLLSISIEAIISFWPLQLRVFFILFQSILQFRQ